MESTLRTHYGRFIHASQAAALELAEIDPMDGKKRSLPHGGANSRKNPLNYKRKMVDDAVRCQLLSMSTCQPVDTHTAVDKRRLTQGG